MTTSIGGSYGPMAMMQRPDPSQMASKLFSKLDAKNQGYIDKSDLQSAFARISGSAGSDASTSVDDVFKQFDGDGDGKITKDELSSGFTKLAETLDSQFGQMRMDGFGVQGGHHGVQGMGGMPPPSRGGPGEGDAGFTKDGLGTQLEQMGTSDSKRSSLISDIVSNFDQADSDGDGKVNRKEAMAFEKANSKAAFGSESSAAASGAAAQSSEAKLMHRIMELMHAYSTADQSSNPSTVASQLSVAA